MKVVFDEVWTKALDNARLRRQSGKMGQVATDTGLQKEEAFPPSDVSGEDIITGEGGPMNKGRRNVTIALAGIPIVLPSS